MPQEPKKKNQHYVPVFYLKRFSNNGKSIGVFVMSSRTFIERGSIDGQASKSYFYGRDGVLENGLGKLEGIFATTLRQLDTVRIVKANTKFFKEVLHFIIHTDLRNPVRRKEMNDLYLKSTTDLLLRLDRGEIQMVPLHQIDEAKALIRKLHNEVTDDVGAVFEIIDKALPVLSREMSFRLLVNKTPKPFVTSDHPVIIYNQFFEFHGKKPVISGYGSKGLQIFLPINSTRCLFVFDNRIYHVGSKNEYTHIINNCLDVDQLNLLQMNNCLNAVYGDSAFRSEYANDLFDKMIKPYSFTEDRSATEGVGLSLSFCKLSPSAIKFKFRMEINYVRSQMPEVTFHKNLNAI